MSIQFIFNNQSESAQHHHRQSHLDLPNSHYHRKTIDFFARFNTTKQATVSHSQTHTLTQRQITKNKHQKQANKQTNKQTQHQEQNKVPAQSEQQIIFRMLSTTRISLSYRTIAERFWSPFCQGLRGPDITRYKARENLVRLTMRQVPNHASAEARIRKCMPTDTRLDAISRPPPTFSCQVNAIVGDGETAENMLIAILTGFDVQKVVFDPSAEHSPNIKGSIFVHHCRPFLGWQSTNTTIFFPFSMFIEGDPDASTISHLVLHLYFDEALRNAGCPEEVITTISNRKAMRMLADLRRALVSPDAITCESLSAALAEKESWVAKAGPFE